MVLVLHHRWVTLLNKNSNALLLNKQLNKQQDIYMYQDYKKLGIIMLLLMIVGKNQEMDKINCKRIRNYSRNKYYKINNYFSSGIKALSQTLH